MVQRPKLYTKVKSDFGKPGSGSPFWPPFTNRNELVGHPIGWVEVINKVRNILTAWKAKSLSIDGSLTLLKSVLGSIPIYYLSLFKAPLKVIKYIESLRSRFFWGFKDDHRGISWVNWDSILAGHEFGGLGVGRLLPKNLALLGKWKWCFLLEKDALWRKVICNFYGGDGGFYSSPTSLNGHGVWCDIIKVISNIKRIDFSFKNCFTLKVSNGLSTSFWKDAWWHDGSRLMDAFPKLFALESFQDCRAIDDLASLLSSLNNLFLSLGEDEWVWNGDASGKFKVKIYVWRASLNRLPTRLNLVSRGISLDSVLCPFCELVEETLDHCLISCPLVSPVWRKIWVWWGLDRPVSFPSFSIADISLGAIGLPNHHFLSNILNGVFSMCFMGHLEMEEQARCKRLSLSWKYWISSSRSLIDSGWLRDGGDDDGDEMMMVAGVGWRWRLLERG
nr:reverse transcriptase domain, reverse transcriptase zinc-binding domain protein [Tanacetum cinerariifolium]